MERRGNFQSGTNQSRQYGISQTLTQLPIGNQQKKPYYKEEESYKGSSRQGNYQNYQQVNPEATFSQASQPFYKQSSQGQRPPNNNRGGNNQPTFDSRPKASQFSQTKSSQVKLITNQYQLKLGNELSVYQYDISITPDVMNEAFLINNILRGIKKRIEVIFGLYVISGRSIYSTHDLEDNLVIETEFQSMKYVVLISAESKKYFSGKSITNSKMEDNNVIFNLINIIIKQAFRDTDLRQIGKQPRFFDISKAVNVEGSGLQACPGFRASAFSYQTGLALVLDSINKFISNKTCYERIQEIFESEYINDKINKVLEEFKFKSVIGMWGNKKAYIVMDVIFDKNPLTMYFVDGNGKKMSIAEYFSTTYKLKIKERKQPLFMVKINGKECYLPTEFCTIDGVPQQIREDPMKMRNVLSSCRKNPDQKFQAIQDFSKDLFGQRALQNWGIEIAPEPIHITSKILPLPNIALANGGFQNCDQKALRNLPVQRAKKLQQERWIMVYDNRNFNNANNVLQQFQQASRQLQMSVEDPLWIELENFNRPDEFESQLRNLLKKSKGEPSIIVLMLTNDRQYKTYKNICYNLNLISQVISSKTVRKMNLSVATNLLKQINSKLGGDLYNIGFSKELSMNTMLIGIDVCHSGPQSIVGFCASINKDMSQYYSEKLNQKRGQEIVDKQLKDALKRAMSCFYDRQGDNPEHFIIYRDGVGDAMRRQVLQKEISQFKEAINETYNLAKKKPFITVIIVNKRITQRFFVEDGSGQLANPPSGCLIDEQIVENQDSNIEYDFYLVPQNTTQGCVLPTHFYVAHNNSPLKKETIEQLTYDLCHYYFNWAGPIKVPAPCMYAHKIAELYMNIGKDVPTKNLTSKVYEVLHFL